MGTPLTANELELFREWIRAKAERSKLRVGSYWPHASRFTTGQVQPPSPIYVTTDDLLTVAVNAQTTAQSYNVRWRVLSADGEVHDGTEILTPVSNVTTVSKVIDLYEGWLISLCISVGGTGVQAGHAYALARLERGTGSPANPHIILIGRYITPLHWATWPNGLVMGNEEGPGKTLVVQPGNPGAGTDLSVTISTGFKTRLQSISFLYTASAVVANRQIDLVLDDGATIYFRVGASVNLTASQARQVSFGAGTSPQNAAGLALCGPLPVGMVLLPGHRIRTITTGIDVGDQISAVRISEETWITI